MCFYWLMSVWKLNQNMDMIICWAAKANSHVWEDQCSKLVSVHLPSSNINPEALKKNRTQFIQHLHLGQWDTSVLS